MRKRITSISFDQVDFELIRKLIINYGRSQDLTQEKKDRCQIIVNKIEVLMDRR